MTEELSKGFTGIEINGVRFSNIKEMLIYMNKQRVRIIDLENENAELKYQLNKNPCVKTPEWYCSDCLKENAELKEVHESDKRSLALIAKKGADFEKAYNEAEELLDKQIEATYKLFKENKEAKEIIKELLFTSNELDENTRSKAEQFLKEVKE